MENNEEWRFIVPNDNPHFVSFADEIWNRRPSSLVGLGMNVFSCEFSLDGIDILVEGDLRLGERCRVRSVSNICINRLITEKDGTHWSVPFYKADLAAVFHKLTEIFLDRTPNPGRILIGETYLETPERTDEP